MCSHSPDISNLGWGEGWGDLWVGPWAGLLAEAGGVGRFAD